MSLLQEYINAKLNSYHEPTRAGTSKGSPIGFSRKKYHAALLCLHKQQLKKIAETAAVSLGTLRVWRTKDEFKETIAELRNEFFTYKQRRLQDYDQGDLIAALYNKRMHQTGDSSRFFA